MEYHGGNRMTYRYKWEQIGAVSVGFRIVWDDKKKGTKFER